MTERMGNAILQYVRDRVAEKEMTRETAEEFFRYVGLDAKNLRTLLEVPQPFAALSDQAYSWEDVCGKNASIDLNTHMKETVSRIQHVMEEKKTEVRRRALDCILRGLRERGDAAFAARMMDPREPYGFCRMLEQEKQLDYAYLVEINKNTFHEIVDKDTRTRAERPGIFGHRREMLDDLLETVDLFLHQRYEMYRYKTVTEICEQLISDLSASWEDFPEGVFPEDCREIMDRMGVYAFFEGSFLETFRTRAFLTGEMIRQAEEQYAEIAGQFPPAAEKIPQSAEAFSQAAEAVPPAPDLRLFAEGIEKTCIIVKKEQIILNIYGITEINREKLGPAELLALHRKLQQEGPRLLSSRTYVMDGGEDLRALLSDEIFVDTLKQSIAAVDRHRRIVKELAEGF